MLGKKNERSVSAERPDPNPRGKGRPTPKRKVAEAARRTPIVPADRSAAKKMSREQKRLERQRRDEFFARKQQGIREGDERYMDARDKGPTRRFIRDYIDSRYTIGEWVVPLTFVFLLVSIFLRSYPEVQVWLGIGIYAVLFIAFAETFIHWRRVRKHIETNHTRWDIPNRSWWYLMVRILMPRFLRRPHPQVSRGEYPK